jgi:hypothetical protein
MAGNKLLLALVLVVSISGCSKLPALLTGGGPNVAANVQAGKTNSQTLGTTSNVSSTVRDSQVDKVDQSITTTKLSSDRVETVIVNEMPIWVVLLLLLGWLLPSPNEIARWISNAFKRRL